MPKNVFDVNELVANTRGGVAAAAGGLFEAATDIVGGFVDGATAFLGRNISIQLISATKTDGLGNGKVGKQTFLEKHLPTLPTLGDRQDAFNIHFEWDDNFGIPGAFYIKNFTQSEFFLVSLTLQDIPNHGKFVFSCNSWVYNAKCYKKDRIFFANKTYLPHETPTPLFKYRAEELENLRGDGKGERKEHDRIYDYAVYNDLGNPDKDPINLARPTLGGTSEYPYPRRGRTGRKSTRTDHTAETPTSDTYIPRDENFGHLKSSDFLTYGIKAVTQNLLPQFQSVCGLNAEFDSFDDVRCLFDGGLFLPTDAISKISPIPVLKEIFRTDGEQFLKFPPPQVIQIDKSAWMTDEEFAREMLAGVNPGMIQLLQEFPPKSKLDPDTYDDLTSTITKEHLEVNLGGLTVEEALNSKRLFILDHHDAFFPFLNKIHNDLENIRRTYATRTILFLKDDGTLKPLAIELSLPLPGGYGAKNRVVLPSAEPGVDNTTWLLAKAYVAVNDTGYHQLISHWLNTHATIEPFVIATNRQLSILHPIYKLLFPHYRDTMNINSLARQSLVNAGGIIEQTFLPGKFSMVMSSEVYKNWVFPDQALPADLIKRGMAIEDPSSPHGLRLVIEDYPYAVDGLEIWSAIKTWVKDYVSLYYASNDAVKRDRELKAWWKEAVEKGHGDLKDKPWWPKLQTVEELIEVCTIIIWIASALHAAVNFGQYPYGGYILNRPTLSRRLIPEKGDPHYEELEKNPQKAYLRTITKKYEVLVDLSVIEILSRHASDEIYLGERDSKDWTSDTKALEAFKKFGDKLKEIERKIKERNDDASLRNRNGPAQMPYTVLLPTSKEGLTFRGIPNSISI